MSQTIAPVNQDPANPSSNTYDQWLRKAEIILVSGSVIYSFDETFRFVFHTTQTDAQTLNTAQCRIYNLSEQTIATLVGKTGVEFSHIVIKAGYQSPGNYGTVFQGTITQFSTGRESAVNSYLDIFAADGDVMNYAVAAQTLAGPVTQKQQVAAVGQILQQQAGIQPIDPNNLAPDSGGILPRGKVLWGWTWPMLRNLGKTRQSTFSIQDGKLVEIPLQGYLAGDVVVINAHTGLIGQPETTMQGVTLVCLLNSKILVGQRIQLNNKEINQTIVTNRSVNPATALNLYASEAADGVYKVAVIEFTGDTRGSPWYSNIVALAVDPSAAPANSVSLTGNGS